MNTQRLSLPWHEQAKLRLFRIMLECKHWNLTSASKEILKYLKILYMYLNEIILRENSFFIIIIKSIRDRKLYKDIGKSNLFLNALF